MSVSVPSAEASMSVSAPSAEASMPVNAPSAEASMPVNAPSAGLQVLLSVSKRRFKHAVDRNRVKRQLREAFRKHQSLLNDRLHDGQHLSLAFIWLSDHHHSSAEIEKRVVSLLKRIADRL